MAVTTTTYVEFTDEELAEFFSNRRIRGPRFRDLNRNGNYLYLRTVNRIGGYVWKGDTAVDWFSRGTATFGTGNSATGLGLDEINDQMLPTVESNGSLHFVSVKAFGANISLRLNMAGKTSTAACTTIGWYRNGMSFAAVTTPEEVYFTASATQGDPEDGTDRLYALEVIETILTPAQL